MDDLTPRKERILRAIVLEYVQTAEPVGSSLLVERYEMGVGAATIRNELADMSERGYLEQPHTSAGRIPSDSGYRYYVDRLGEPEQPEQAKPDSEIASVDHLLQDTVRLLARVTQHVSVAATVRESGVTIRQVSINGITPQRALMVVVLSNADVEDHMIEAAPDLTLSDLQVVGARLTTAVEGKRLKQLLRLPAPGGEGLKPAAANLLARAWRAVKAVARENSSGRLVSEGTAFLLSQPEFQRDYGALTEVVKALEDANLLHSALDGSSAGVAVTIGRENPQDALKRLAVIAARFHVGGEDAGAIAVIGPTRMNYDRAIPLVEQTAKALSDALTRLMR